MVKEVSVNKRVLNILVSLLIFITIVISVSGQDYLALQGSAAGSGRGIGAGTGQGNITVEIWSAASAGSLLYNSSSDFWGALNNSRYDILLGNSSQPLSLNFSNTYYMELYINERELDFNGTERQVFQSSVGNITVTTPIKTTKSLNVNDFFNITGVTSAVRTNGTVTILSSDTDDALNISNGAVNLGTRGSQAGVLTSLSTSSPAFTINNGFNVSGANSDLSTNGTIVVSSGNGFRAANQVAISLGGATDAAPTHSMAVDTNGVLNITGSVVYDKFFNITPATSAVRTNGTITILNTVGNALSINGGVNITGATLDFRTNGTITMLGTLSPLPIFTVNNGFNISGANSALSTNGTITIESVAAPAFTVNGGFNVSGASGVLVTNSTVAINTRRANALTIGSGFNVTGPAGTLVTNGTINIQNPSLTPAFTVNNGFNISGTDESLRTNGTVTILNTDTDDALNISGGLKMGSGVGSTFTLASFTISDQGIITTDPTIGPATGRGHIIINSLTEPALRINSGFNVSGTSGAMRTNGTATITNADVDDALNVTGGAIFGATSSEFLIFNANDPNQLFTIKNIFNVTPDGNMRTSGTVTIRNADVDDALNVTGSIASQGAAITIGNAESTTQHRLEVFDGGTNKCAYIRLFDDVGADWFLFANSTGQLRMFADAPTGAGQCNTGGNGVGGQPN